MMAYRKAKNRGGGKVRNDGRTLNGFNRRAGKRNRCHRCDCGYHVAPKRPWWDTPRGGLSAVPQGRDKARGPPYSSITRDTPVSAQQAEHLETKETTDACEQSFSVTMDVGNLFSAPVEDSVVVLDTGATANLVRFRWLEQCNRLRGSQRVFAYLSNAGLRFGCVRVGDVRPATDIPAGIAENKSNLTAYALGADIPALGGAGRGYSSFCAGRGM